MTVSRCYFHGEEPVTDTTYRVCFECRHVYETADDLVEAHIQAMDGLNPRLDPEQIFACPECIHDF